MHRLVLTLVASALADDFLGDLVDCCQYSSDSALRRLIWHRTIGNSKMRFLGEAPLLTMRS